MKICLVTTTIHVPHVLRLYRAYGPDVQFFVIGDRKTPHGEVDELCRSLGLATYYSPEFQQELGYSCSEIIGWNSIQRRNIGFLEALKWGADVIVSVDDDNAPMAHGYFDIFQWLFARPFAGLRARRNEVSASLNWFDVGRLLDPPVQHRGFPIDTTSIDLEVDHAIDAEIGVVAGLWFGDPDIHAVDRLSQAPSVHRCSELLRQGFVVQPRTKTVFNSQNTAFVRNLVPAMMMWPGVGRFDDIFASLVCQRAMRNWDLHVHFGQPFVWQQRNKHLLLKDLALEMWGMEHMCELAWYIDQASTCRISVVQDLHDLYSHLPDFVPSIVRECGQAYLEDCERVLK